MKLPESDCKGFPTLVGGLFEAVDTIGNALSKRIVIEKTSRRNKSEYVVYFGNKEKWILWFGVWYRLWEEKGYALAYGVEVDWDTASHFTKLNPYAIRYDDNWCQPIHREALQCDDHLQEIERTIQEQLAHLLG